VGEARKIQENIYFAVIKIEYEILFESYYADLRICVFL